MNPTANLASSPLAKKSGSPSADPSDGDQIAGNRVASERPGEPRSMMMSAQPAAPGAASIPSPVPRSQRGKVATRLTRMFSQTGRAVHKEVEAVKDAIEDRSPDSRARSSSAGQNTPSRTDSSTPSSRQNAPKPHGTSGERKPESETKKTPSRRYEVLEDGSHIHTLKAAKRQEKISDMWRDMFGAGKRKDEPVADDQQLSLMSTWVEQLKLEKEKMDRKGGANSSASLVDKYGKCQEVVGRGAFGVVRISHKIDPLDSRIERLYAVKEFRRRPQETLKKYHKRLNSEFCISSSLRHPNIIHTLDLMQDAKGDYCEVMEYCSGGDLYTLILAAGKLEVGEADCYFKQLMRGVEYMHEMGVAHRDLKPENLLLTNHGTVKITDFGNGECFRMAWEDEVHLTAGLCGSAPYIAPEEYTTKVFDPRAVDVWATGVIYMAMRTGRHLWRVAQKEEDEFYERYLEGRKHEDGYAPIETMHRVRPSYVSFYSYTDHGSGPLPKRYLLCS